MAPLNLDPEELIANYKPLPQLDMKKKKTFEDIDPLAKIMKTKNIRYYLWIKLVVVFIFFILYNICTGQKYTLETRAQFIQKFLNY